MDRTASTLDISPGLAARALGLQYAGNDERPVFFGITLAPASLHALQQTTGLPARALQHMQLDRYDGTALDLPHLDARNEARSQTALGRQWLLLGASRACPRCLAHSDAWPLWWRLGIAAVCPPTAAC
ncbi:TniQ family protein [Streptomyces sp. NRRL F-5755]|uniref:TniQ family protein n=1 Tax=Streptomyces sp. NRRL F-5755 TaxID=1519475 RepID=UPI00099C272B